MFEWRRSLKNNNRSSQRAPVLSDKGKGRAEKSQLCKKKKSPQNSRDDIRKPLRGPSHSLLFLSHGDRLPSLARCLNPQPRSRAKLTQLPFLVKVSLCRSPSICLACSLVVSTHTHSYTHRLQPTLPLERRLWCQQRRELQEVVTLSAGASPRQRRQKLWGKHCPRVDKESKCSASVPLYLTF